MTYDTDVSLSPHVGVILDRRHSKSGTLLNTSSVPFYLSQVRKVFCILETMDFLLDLWRIQRHHGSEIEIKAMLMRTKLWSWCFFSVIEKSTGQPNSMDSQSRELNETIFKWFETLKCRIPATVWSRRTQVKHPVTFGIRLIGSSKCQAKS